eukprot:2314708-Amphidinium_carterae.1
MKASDTASASFEKQRRLGRKERHIVQVNGQCEFLLREHISYDSMHGYRPNDSKEHRERESP